MTYYTVPGGGGVLATGSAMFVCRLSDAPDIDPAIVFPAIPGVTPVLWRMMENVFALFGAGPASSSATLGRQLAVSSTELRSSPFELDRRQTGHHGFGVGTLRYGRAGCGRSRRGGG